MTEVQPNQTVYIQNLNEKLSKDDLRLALYSHLSQFGPILEITLTKNAKLRGQAWVAFDALGGAAKAIRALEGTDFYGKPMHLTFAKSTSHCVARINGTYHARDYEKSAMKVEPTQSAGAADASASSSSATQIQIEDNPPNKILFLQNLPKLANDMMLSVLFQQYDGLKEVRMVASKPGIAFVEFNDQWQAGIAKDSLQNFQITPEQALVISYAKTGPVEMEE